MQVRKWLIPFVTKYDTEDKLKSKHTKVNMYSQSPTYNYIEELIALALSAYAIIVLHPFNGDNLSVLARQHNYTHYFDSYGDNNRRCVKPYQSTHSV